MSPLASEPTFFSTLSPDTLISFKYTGGSTPGKERTVRFVSWFWDSEARKRKGEGYLQAEDLFGVGRFKSYHYSKMCQLKVCSTPEQSVPESEIMTQNDLSNWTSWIKQGDTIEFTYMNQTQIRNVKFANFRDTHSPTKQKIITEVNGGTKTFFINKMTIHKITPAEVFRSILVPESKKDLLIKEMKAHINSLNIIIANLNEKCYSLEDQVQQAYSIMNTRNMRCSST
tara:strand:+ start:147 stop:830 length:684 start_codon:yes stop_codon:yes gene_type:complete